MGCVCSDMVTKDRCEEPLNEESVIKQYSWFDHFNLKIILMALICKNAVAAEAFIVHIFYLNICLLI